MRALRHGTAVCDTVQKNEQAFLFLFPAIFNVLEIPVIKGGALREKSWEPYQPYVTVPLAAAHRADRLVFFDWILQQPEGLKSM